MRSFSIWYLLLKLFLLLGIPTLIGYFAIKNENTELRISRLQFLYWVVGPLLISSVVAITHILLIVLLHVDEAILKAIVNLTIYFIALGYTYPAYQRYVRRARDAGLRKTIAYFSLLPIVYLVPTLVLLFKPSQAGQGDTKLENLTLQSLE